MFWLIFYAILALLVVFLRWWQWRLSWRRWRRWSRSVRTSPEAVICFSASKTSWRTSRPEARACLPSVRGGWRRVRVCIPVKRRRMLLWARSPVAHRGWLSIGTLKILSPPVCAAVAGAVAVCVRLLFLLLLCLFPFFAGCFPLFSFRYCLKYY